MTCTRCGQEIEQDSQFCRHCGSSREQTGPRRLFRHPAQGRLAGVCAGIADYLGADVTVVRLLWVIISIVPGFFIGGLVAYIAAAIVMPTSTVVSGDHRVRLERSPTDRRLGGVCGGIAEFFRMDSTIVRLIWVVLSIVPGLIVFGVVAYCIAWFIMPVRQAPALVSTPHAA
jgi:phage shock protein C